MAEDLNRRWLWVAGVAGVLLVVLATLLDLVWGVQNILPNVVLDVGIGTVLFAVLFLLERRIVQRTTMVWVSAVEEFAARSGQDPEEAAAHFAGPVTVVFDFIGAILDNGDYKEAWHLADPNWRLCRAQSWLWSNSTHPLVSSFDRDEAAEALAQAESTHALWGSFAATELDQFSEAWSDPDLRTYGAASARRVVEDGEIVFLVDLSDHPHGAMVRAPTPVNGVPFLVREIDETWHIANLVGDHLPQPGWPPDWKEGWTYWEDFLDQEGSE